MLHLFNILALLVFLKMAKLAIDKKKRDESICYKVDFLKEESRLGYGNVTIQLL